MTLRDHDKREALANKYGWHISGWAVDEDNEAGISLYSLWNSSKHLRMQHRWSLKDWEKVLKQNVEIKPKKVKLPPKAKTFDDVVAENAKLKAELKLLKKPKRR